CLFSSIGYVVTTEALRRTVAAFAEHLAPGGVLVIEPWFTPTTYWHDTITGNYLDRPDLKIAMVYTSQLEEGRSILEQHYLIGTKERVEHLHQRHVLGLFSTEDFRDAFSAAALEPRDVDPAGWPRGVHVALRPPA